MTGHFSKLPWYPPFFSGLPQTIATFFKGYFLLIQLIAIGATALLVYSGLDWQYFIFFNSTLLQKLLFPAVILGFFLPILLPIILWIVAVIRKNQRTLIVAAAAGQAAALGLLFSFTYKAFTGRIPPIITSDGALTDISHGFQFGFMRGGVFWGWPSSHTTVAFALATTLYVLFPEKKALRILVLIYAFYIGLGISMSIHWLSEFVAGALFGSVVGITVGRYFWQKLKNTSAGLSK